jgi:nitrogen PTS system EIIA component
MSTTIAPLLSEQRTAAQIAISSKKRLFEYIAERLYAEDDILPVRDTASRLMSREKLGSTGLGLGIAIPHSRLEHCHEITGVLITLDQPIDFDAPDGIPVDIIFALVVPENEQQKHLTTLAALAGLFRQPRFCEAVRQCKSSESLLTLVNTWE